MIRAEDVKHYQLTVSERVFGEPMVLDHQDIHDPFIRTKVWPRGWRVALAVLFRRYEIVVQVEGTEAAHRAVFNSDYTPQERERPERLDAYVGGDDEGR